MKVVIAILAILLIAVVAFLCVGFALDWSFIPDRGETTAPEQERALVIGGEVVAPALVMIGSIIGA